MELDTLLGYVFSYQIILLVLIVITLKSSIKFVPQNRAYIIERFGKYNTTLEAGLNFIVPFIDKVAANRSLKERQATFQSNLPLLKTTSR